MGLFSRAKRIGEVPVPGGANLELPAGKVKLRYEEAREGRNPRPDSGGRPFGASPQLVLTVRPVDGGDALTIEQPRGVQRGAGGGRIWSGHGSIEIPATGEYEVVAGEVTETAAESPERIDPRIVLLAKV
jgi:hypothetical protein